MGQRSQVTTPLIREGTPIGVLVVQRQQQRAFTEREIALLEAFADQAVIAIENARLFQELEQRNAELRESNRQVGEALKQQTATADVLRVIASSPTNLQTILDTIAESVTLLCDGGITNMHRIDDQAHLYLAAVFASDSALAARPWSTNDRRPITETDCLTGGRCPAPSDGACR